MMSKPDLAHHLTDKELAALEQRIAAEYKKAAEELNEKINAYFAQFSQRDKETKALIGTMVNGMEYTEKDYQQWRLAQIGRGKRFEALRDRVAERMTKANEVAAAYINDTTPGLYSLNRNYAAYIIEQQVGANVGFDLWDEQTVKRLIVEQPDLMPYYPPERAVKRGIDLAWGKRQITSQVTTGILMGDSIKHLSDRLQTNIPNMNRNSAIRAARTAVTGAQNAGRMDSYAAAEGMGINLKKRWISTLDGRTRHAHALLDGQTQPNDKPFHSILGDIMFPGDPSATPANIYNCRCTLIAEVDGVDMSDAVRRARNPETGDSELIENMTYAEWAGWKDKKSNVPQKIDWLDGARTPADVVLAMENQGWFKLTQRYSASLDGADFDGAVAVYRGYEKFFEKYPQMVGKFLPVVCEDLSRGKAYAQASMMGGGISVNRKVFSNGKALADEYLKDVALKFHPAGTDWQSLVTHECGHGLDGFLTATLKSKNPVSADMRKSVLKACGKKASDIPEEVSIYASQNNFEFFSECLAEGLWSETPRPVATEFMRQLDEIMKGIV